MMDNGLKKLMDLSLDLGRAKKSMTNVNFREVKEKSFKLFNLF